MQNLKFTSTITDVSYIFVLYLTGTIYSTLSAAKLASCHPAIKLLASLTKKDIGTLFQLVSYELAIYIIFFLLSPFNLPIKKIV